MPVPDWQLEKHQTSPIERATHRYFPASGWPACLHNLLAAGSKSSFVWKVFYNWLEGRTKMTGSCRYPIAIRQLAIGAFAALNQTNNGMPSTDLDDPSIPASISAFAIIVAAKLTEGAWNRDRRDSGYHGATDRDPPLLSRRLAAREPFALGEIQPPTVLVAYERRNRMTDRALRFALTLSLDVLASHLLRLAGPQQDEDIAAIKDKFDREICTPLREQRITPPRLVTLPAPYRDKFPLSCSPTYGDGRRKGRKPAEKCR